MAAVGGEPSSFSFDSHRRRQLLSHQFQTPQGELVIPIFLKSIFPLLFSSQPLYRYGGPIAMRKSHFNLGVIFKISFLKTKITTSAVPGIPRANPEHLRPIFERFASKTKNGKLYMTAEDFIRRLIKFLLFALFSWVIYWERTNYTKKNANFQQISGTLAFTRKRATIRRRCVCWLQPPIRRKMAIFPLRNSVRLKPYFAGKISIFILTPCIFRFCSEVVVWNSKNGEQISFKIEGHKKSLSDLMNHQ